MATIAFKNRQVSGSVLFHSPDLISSLINALGKEANFLI